MLQPLMLKKLKLTSPMKTYNTSRMSKGKKKKKDALFIIGDWNEKVESQEIHGKQASLDLE